MMAPLLFWVSCVTDISFLKPQKEPSSDSSIVKGSRDRPSQIPSDEKGATSKGLEEEKSIPSAAEIQKEQKPALSPKTENEKAYPSPAKIAETQKILTPPTIEEAKTEYTPLKGEKEKQIASPAKIEEEQPVPLPGKVEEEKLVTSPLKIEHEQQTAAPPKIDIDKIAPYPLKLEEEKPALTSTKKQEEQAVAVSSEVKRGQEIATLPKIEDEKSITSTVQNKEEETISLPAEIEEMQGVVTLPQIKDEQSIHLPAWLEQGKPVFSAAEVEGDQKVTTLSKIEDEKKEERPTPTPGKIEEAQKLATLPQTEEKQTLSPPEGSEKEEVILTPVEIESPLPPTPETQKQSDQEMLDSALEFCQASYDFWEQGDLYNAIDALDQAYSLILKINPEDESELLQQKEDLRFTISKRIIEVYSSRFTVANGHNSVIPLVMNRHVEKALALFKGRERKFFLDSYRRSGEYRTAILRALKESGLPEELSWLPLIESGFKIRALSRSRALGLWQFVASTGYKFGLKRDTWVDERMDPEKATVAAIAYLKELHRIFGDWTTALAAYNCGEGKVLKCIRTQKINYLDNFWDLYERLPVETAFYVPKFLAVLHILNDPKAHGFILPPVQEEIETEEVTIDKQVHLKTISKHLDISYRLLKDLNPSLRYSYTPNRAYSFKVPKGKGAVLLAKLGDIPVWHPPVSAYVVHKVRKGESLSVIARRYGTNVRAIMALNGLRRSHFIRTGWKLKIPTRRRYAVTSKASSTVSSSHGRRELLSYVVQKGDSLWRIADRFGTTTKAIQSANQLNDTRLRIGQSLMIPQGQISSEEMKTRTYIVLKGDSPYLIAKKHHMKLSQFLRINNLSPRSTIFPGQLLLVRAE